MTLFAPIPSEYQAFLEDSKPFCVNLVAPDIVEQQRPRVHGQTRCHRYWEMIATLEPPLRRHYDLGEPSRAIERLAEQVHLTWVYKSWIAGPSLSLDWQRTIVDFDDLLFRVMRRTMRHTPWYGSKLLSENLDIWKEELFERRLCRLAARVLVCSEGDRRILAYDNVGVLPNCVDVPTTSPSEPSEDPDRLLFIGKMDSQPNVDAARHFCESILPSIRTARARAHVYIVGREPPPAIRALHTGTDVFVTGTVPDTTPYFNGAGVVIVPLRAGGGTRVKILEAFAHRKAVVSTDIGSEGLAVQHGVHLLQANTPGDFAAACAALMSDASLRKALGVAGRALMETHYSQAVFERTVRRHVSEVIHDH